MKIWIVFTIAKQVRCSVVVSNIIASHAGDDLDSVTVRDAANHLADIMYFEFVKSTYPEDITRKVKSKEQGRLIAMSELASWFQNPEFEKATHTQSDIVECYGIEGWDYLKKVICYYTGTYFLIEMPCMFGCGW